MMAMRNIIPHVYFGIDWNEAWQAAVSDVGALKAQIEFIVNSLPPEKA
jgi:uncharacterized protein with HEPN domain